jgi:hypothetical protein
MITKTFSAAGVSLAQLVQPGESFTYSLSSAGHTGQLVIESSTDNFATLRREASHTGTAGSLTTASATLINETNKPRQYRAKSLTFTSGNITATLNDVTPKASQAPVKIDRKIIFSAAGRSKVGGTSGFVVAAADNIALVTCPASQSGSKLVVPLSGLRPGDIIRGFHLIGQVESGGNTATVDAQLRVMKAAAADVTDALVGSITQASFTADGILSATNTRKAGLNQPVAEDETYYVLITVTTAAATDIALQGVALEVTQAN